MNTGFSFLTAAGLGAAMTYYLDPDRGRRRRANVRDQFDHFGHAVPHQLGVAGRDLRNRAQGIASRGRSYLWNRGQDLSDDVIEDRIRSALGRVVSHPHSIAVCSDDGNVILAGYILSHELKPLLQCVAQVNGVKSVDNQLESHREDDHIPSLQGGVPRLRANRPDFLQSNWSPGTRLLMGLAGGSLLSFAAYRRGAPPLRALSGLAGLLVVSRSITNLETRRILGFGGRKSIQLRKTIHINAPVDEVYRFWSDFENFPKFMTEVLEVRAFGDKRRSHWTVRGPAGTPIHFDAEKTTELPNQRLAWRSVPGSLFRHAGQVQFFPSEVRGTKIELDFSYNPPAGILGHELARLFGSTPKKRIEMCLAEMKQIIEQGPSPRQARALFRRR